MDNLVPSCRYCNEARGRQREAVLDNGETRPIAICPSSILDSGYCNEARGRQREAVLDNGETRPIAICPSSILDSGENISSQNLLNGKKEVLIDHNGSVYHLSVTPHNGLRLHK